MDHYIERVVDLLEPGSNRLYNMSIDEAQAKQAQAQLEVFDGANTL